MSAVLSPWKKYKLHTCLYKTENVDAGLEFPHKNHIIIKEYKIMRDNHISQYF